MSKWIAIHSGVDVSQGDGFHWIRIPFIGWVPEGTKNPFVEMLNIKSDKELSPDSAMRMFMCRQMDSTFCIGKESSGDGGRFFIIGVRSEKDIFQLKLRFADADETVVRSYGTQFYVRVRDGDSFSEKGEFKGQTDVGESIQ